MPLGLLLFFLLVCGGSRFALLLLVASEYPFPGLVEFLQQRQLQLRSLLVVQT